MRANARAGRTPTDPREIFWRGAGALVACRGTVPTVRPLLIGLLTALAAASACAHSTQDASSQPPANGAEVAHLAQKQKQLEERVARLEDRLRVLARGAGAGVSLAAAEPAPVRPEPRPPEPRGQPSARPGGEGGDGDAIGLFREPVTLARSPSPAGETSAAAEPTAAAPSAPEPETQEAPAEAPRRSFRLEGRKLVELTRAPPKLVQAAPEPARGKRHRRRRSKDPVIAAYDEAMELLRAGRHAEARKAFDRIARRHPRHPYADNALYWKGEAAYDAGDYEAALADFTAVVERYAGGNKAPDALLKIALCYQRLGRTREAVDLMTELIEAYPRAHAADVARLKLVEIRG